MSARLDGYGAEHVGWAQGSLAFGARSLLGHTEAAVLADQDAGIVLVADVRLDERIALCDALGVLPAERAQTKDSALLLRAYKRWGESCAEHLAGDYAFAIWDQRQGALFCCRSALGQRPFYWAYEGGMFAFGTAIGAVLASPGIPEDLDEDLIAALFVRPYQSYVPGRTLFRAVRRLRPGHALELRAGSVRCYRYWRPEVVATQRLGAPDAYAEALLELITRAVEDRLRGGPVASHLSGGLDSSAVTVLAARLSRRAGGRPVPAFCWLPCPPRPMPASWAPSYSMVRSVSDQEGLRVSYATLSKADVLAVFRRDGAYPEGAEWPNAEAAYREAREQGVRILLTGTLGDQFASCDGYGYDAHLLVSGRWLRLLGRARTEGMDVLRAAAGGVRRNTATVWYSLRRRLWESSREGNLANPEFRRRATLPPRPALSWFGGVRHRQLHFLKEELHGSTFEINTAAAALHGIECRHPLADRRVVEFVLGVPPDVFRCNGQPRWLMRAAMRSVLPEDVRTKRGKGEPVLGGPESRRSMLDALPELRQLAAADPSRTRHLNMAKVLAGVDEAICTDRLRLRFDQALRFLCR